MDLSALSRVRLPLRLGCLALLSMLLVVAGTATASAASYSATGLSASVSGTSVTARVTFASSPAIEADVAQICVRDAAGTNFDFSGSADVKVASAGTGWQQTATFPSGTYRYFACVQENGRWTDIGETKSFTVGGGSPSGAAMPVGSLPGWRQTFTEDFKQPLSRGGFPGGYASQWMSYSGFPNTSQVGYYDQKIISAQGGVLDIHLQAENGRPLTAAPVPLVDGAWGGQLYGRFSVRMKADPARGYGASFLLWSDSNNWSEGEIDFPESGFDDSVKGYNHCIGGNPAENCLSVRTDERFTSWHTYTIDWRPEKLVFLIDGAEVASTTKHIPSTPMHWVLQIETPRPAEAAKSSGHVLIDWATIYERA